MTHADDADAGGARAEAGAGGSGQPAPLPELPLILVEDAVRAALWEDLGRAGDVTSVATIPADRMATAHFVARKPGRVAGLACVRAAFALIDPAIRIELSATDGAPVMAGGRLATVTGPARALLTAERVALNFLCHLSGVASLTNRFVDAIAGTRARICCTRKTMPGLRALQKYAVRCGGGSNHRYGLDDAMLIKDNHIAVCGGVAQALDRARAAAGHLTAIEIEVDTLEQLREAINHGAGVVLLDNFTPDALREAVSIVDGRAVLEASGGIALETVRAVAETGVDFISTSQVTMSAPSLDIGFDIAVDA